MGYGLALVGFGRRVVTRAGGISVCMAIVATLAGCSGGEDGEPVVDLGPTAVGTCLDFGDSVGADVESLPVVPCEDPHTHEIIAVKQSDADTYPGLEALEVDAQAQCLAAFDDYVGINYFDSDLFVSWLVPTLSSWDKDDDREIVCVVGEDNGAPLIGSVRGIAR